MNTKNTQLEDISAPPKEESPETILPKEPIAWIRWWLFFLAIVICLIPFKLIFVIKSLFISGINDGTFYMFWSSDSAFYVPYFLITVCGEFLGNLFFIFASLVLIFLFFKKHRLFPWLFKLFLLTNILFVVADYFIVTWLNLHIPYEDTNDTLKEIFQALVAGVLWWSYVHKSKRVHHTFINDSFQEKSIFSKIVIILACISIGNQLSHIQWEQLTKGRSQSSIIKNENIFIGSWFTINGNKYQLSPYTELNNKESGTLGFLWEHGSIVLTIPESFDDETAQNLSFLSENEIYQSVQSTFEEDMDIKIQTGSIEHIWENTFYTYLWSGNMDGNTYIYSIWYIFHKNYGLSFYSYGFDKNIIQKEGKKLIHALNTTK